MTLRRLKPDNCHTGPEWRFQIAAMKLIKSMNPNIIPVHVPNEGKRNGMQQRVSKSMGLTSGISDILIFESGKSHNGLAIELKIWPSKATDNQIAFLEMLERNNWLTGICYSLDQVKALLERY